MYNRRWAHVRLIVIGLLLISGFIISSTVLASSRQPVLQVPDCSQWSWSVDKLGNQDNITVAPGATVPINYYININANLPDGCTSGGSVDACVNVTDSMMGDLGQVCADANPFEVLLEYRVYPGPFECGTSTLSNVATITTSDTATQHSNDHNIIVNVPCESVCPWTWTIDKLGNQDNITVAPGATVPINYYINLNAELPAGCTVGTSDGCVTVTDSMMGNLGEICADTNPFEVLLEYRVYPGPFECGTSTLTNVATFTTNNSGTTGSNDHNILVNVICNGTPTATPPPPPPPPPPPGNFEGCTPGYWKQDHHFDSWVATGYDPFQTLESVFDLPDSLTMDNIALSEAMYLHGGGGVGGAARLLMHHATAALLNSAHPDITYPLSTADLIAQVNTAIASNDRDTMLELKDLLDDYNNADAGCPLN